MSLINKSYRSTSHTSRYSSLPYFYDTENNKYVYGTSKHLSKDCPYTLHTVVYGDTFDSLSLKYYNNPTYFWVICDFNNISDSLKDLKVGEELKIPSLTSISFN